MQHRRSLPFRGSIDGHTPVVLDDTSRLLSTTWLALGDAVTSNRMRQEGKMRRYAPPVLAFAPLSSLTTTTNNPPPSLSRALLAPSIRLQSVRMLNPNGTEWLLRLQHMYAAGEDPTLSKAQAVDLEAIIKAVLPPTAAKRNGGGAASAWKVLETTLDGMNDVSTLARRRHFPTEGSAGIEEVAGEAVEVEAEEVKMAAGAVTIGPMEVRTWRVYR